MNISQNKKGREVGSRVRLRLEHRCAVHTLWALVDALTHCPYLARADVSPGPLCTAVPIRPFWVTPLGTGSCSPHADKPAPVPFLT